MKPSILFLFLLFGGFFALGCEKENFEAIPEENNPQDTTAVITPIDTTTVISNPNPLCAIPLGSFESLREALQGELGALLKPNGQISSCGISTGSLRMQHWFFNQLENTGPAEQPNEFRLWLGGDACPTAPRLWPGEGQCDTTAKSIVTIVNYWTGDTVYVGRFRGGFQPAIPGQPKIPVNWTFTSYIAHHNPLAGLDSLIRTYPSGVVPAYHLTLGATLTAPDGHTENVWSAISHQQHFACSELVQKITAETAGELDGTFMVLPDYYATVPATLVVRKGISDALQTLYTIPVFVREGMASGTYTLTLQ